MENQCFLQSDSPGVVPYRPVISGRLPVPLVRCPVHPCPISILPVQGTEKVVLLVPTLQTRLICEVPRLAFVDIDLGYGVESERLSTDLPLQVVNDELFVGRVEPEARSQSRRRRRRRMDLRRRHRRRRRCGLRRRRYRESQ